MMFYVVKYEEDNASFSTINSLQFINVFENEQGN